VGPQQPAPAGPRLAAVQRAAVVRRQFAVQVRLSTVSCRLFLHCSFLTAPLLHDCSPLIPTNVSVLYTRDVCSANLIQNLLISSPENTSGLQTSNTMPCTHISGHSQARVQKVLVSVQMVLRHALQSSALSLRSRSLLPILTHCLDSTASASSFYIALSSLFSLHSRATTAVDCKQVPSYVT
jgi:hypothetical protein